MEAERRKPSPIQAERREPPGVWSTRPKPLASAFAANRDAANTLKSNRTANRIAFTTLWCLIGIQAISMLVTVPPGRDRGSAKVVPPGCSRSTA